MLYLELACYNVWDTENFSQYCSDIQCSLMFFVVFASNFCFMAKQCLYNRALLSCVGVSGGGPSVLHG